MWKRFSFPDDPLQRARLAFLALAGLAIASSIVQVLVNPPESAPLLGGTVLGLVALLPLWILQYRTRRLHWWSDLLIGLIIFTFGMALFIPDLGLGLVYVAIYVQALYGSRWQCLRAEGLVIGAYLTAEIFSGFLSSPTLQQFVAFQLPSMIVSAVILRVLHESLVNQRHLTEELEDMIQMEAVVRLTGGIAHDFNNLLTAIIGPLDLALLEVDEEDEIRADQETARRTAERASALTQQLLTFSRNRIVQPERLDLNSELREMESMLRRLVGDSNELGLDLDDGAGEILIDPSSLHQVVTNLVVNARDALDEQPTTPADDAGERGRTVAIRTAVADGSSLPPSRSRSDEPHRDGRYSVIEVEDGGSGMDAATRDKALDPFFTTREQGTGLGLSTVYGIVTQAGGALRIDTEAGEGTRVRVYLPLADREVARECPPEEATAPTGAAPRLGLGS